MSRSAAARTHHDHDHDQRALRRPRPHGAAHARRLSGPAQPPAHPLAHVAAQPARSPAPTQMQMQRAAYAPARPRVPRPIRPPLRVAAGGAAIALRVAESALEVSGSRTMDRLVRSRAWVVIIGIGLIGIVAMQVSMLKLNAGIGRAIESVATLERSNAALKGEVSRLSAGDRIQALAGQKGFVMPEPADVTYLRAGDRRSDSLRAARRMRAPDAAIAGAAGAVTALPDALVGAPGASAGTTGVTAGAAAPVPAPAATTAPVPTPSAATATTAPPATAPTSAPVAPTTPAAAGAAVAPAPTAPQTTSAGGVTPP